MEGVRKMGGLGESIYMQGTLDTLVSLVKAGLLKLSDAAQSANMSEADFSQLMKRKEKDNQCYSFIQQRKDNNFH